MAGLAYSVFPSQAPLLFMQLAGYFTAIFLLSYFFFKIGKRIFAFFILLLAWHPYNIFLQGMVIKDVALMVLWINIFALSLHSTLIRHKSIRFIILLVNIALMLTGILIRDNSFTAAPPLLFLILYGYDADLINSRSFTARTFMFLFTIILAFFFMKGLNSLLLPSDIGNRNYKKSYFVHQLCKYDLIGMSVLNGHKGVTAVLDEKDRHEIEYYYDTLPIYWYWKNAKYIEGKLFKKGFDFLSAWKKSVIQDPFLYMRHRFYIFMKTFGGNPFYHLMWVRQAAQGEFRNMLTINGKSPDLFYTPKTHEDNFVFHTISAYVEQNFVWVGSSFIYALLGILMLVHGFYILHIKKYLSPMINMIKYLNFAALLYYIPYLLFISQPETRYVYPAIVLIILSIPFYLAFYPVPSKRTSAIQPFYMAKFTQ